MERVLILNSSFEPLNIVSWQKAVQLLFQGKVEVIEESSRQVRTVTKAFVIPSVLRLLHYVALKKRRSVIRFSRSHVLLRDQHSCQYCGRKRASHELTLDHVHPAAKGGRRTWENIVAACLQCNQRKGGRTPVEANMKLISIPQEPTWLPAAHTKFTLAFEVHKPPQEWLVYISWSQNNLSK